MFGPHVLNPRHLGVEMSIAVPAEMVSWAPHVVPLPRIVTREIEVAVITGPVCVGILLVLTKGSIVWEPSFTTFAIRHLMVEVQGLQEEWVAYRICELGLELNLCPSRVCTASLTSQRGAREEIT
jgi:hypothetical protein